MADIGVFIGRDTQSAIDSTPIIDGQILFNTDTNLPNRIYADVNGRRIVIGGSVTVDSDLSVVSSNPVQNKVITYYLNEHKNNQTNPHNVTKEQLGLGNVTNLPDSNRLVGGLTTTYGNLYGDTLWDVALQHFEFGKTLSLYDDVYKQTIAVSDEASEYVSYIQGGICRFGYMVFVHMNIVGKGEGWGDEEKTILVNMPIPSFGKASLVNSTGEKLEINGEGKAILFNGWGGSTLTINGIYAMQVPYTNEPPLPSDTSTTYNL